MPLGTEVDLGPGHIMLDGTQQPPLRPMYCGHGCPPRLLLISYLIYVERIHMLSYIYRPINKEIQKRLLKSATVFTVRHNARIASAVLALSLIHI